MKRDDLRDLGLTDGQVDKVMKLNGQDVQAGKQAQEQIETLTAERDGLKEQLTQRDKDMKDLKKQAGDNEELQTKLSDLQTKYDSDTKALSDQLATTKLDSAINSALAGSKARDPQDIKAFLNTETIKFSEQGELVGLDEQIRALQETKAYLFNAEPKTTGTNPVGGSNSAYTGDVAGAIKSNSVNLTEFLTKQQGE